MKIVVYNSSKQYALSRKNIIDITNTLPNSYFAPIVEFHITYSSRGPEIFEYNYDSKIAYFEYEIEQKSDEIILDAIEELLIGLKRIKMRSSFFVKQRKSEKRECEDFVDEWKMKCYHVIKNR